MKTYLEHRQGLNGNLHPLLIEPALYYDPPYERPLEDEFAWHLVKYLDPRAALRYQQDVETPCGKFWVDFVVEIGARRIGFELENLESETEAGLDRLRDAAVVGSGALDVLYRLRGEDAMCRLNDCLAVIARWEPGLVSARGWINLQTLAAPETLACHPRPADVEVRLTFDEKLREDEHDGEAFIWPGDRNAPAGLVLRRLAFSHPAGWVRDYDSALAYYGTGPNKLTRRWAQSA